MPCARRSRSLGGVMPVPYVSRMMEKTTVIYNDTCPICSREVDGYRRMTVRDGLDITYCGISGDGPAALGLTVQDAARRFHVIHNGRRLGGMPAFAVLWDQIPRLRWLARLVRLPLVRPVTEALYDHVAAPALYRLHLRRQRRTESVSDRSKPR